MVTVRYCKDEVVSNGYARVGYHAMDGSSSALSY